MKSTTKDNSDHSEEMPGVMRTSRDAELADLDEPKRLQFGLRALLGFVTISAVFLGGAKVLGTGFGMAIFAIGFYAFMMLLWGLMQISTRTGVVYRTDDQVEAVLCCNFLRSHGLNAVVEGQQTALPGLGIEDARVVVPVSQTRRAEELLADRPEGFQ